ncbi:uncharacterized protein LOC130118454 [Lampris incognitus]|uniref:uncharacterized protein LOC130118454 n=1 Tax=Lampris incognitus TaxID=2546036 RepID=UPI0024B5A794|nr:uncharacterized protein LOC130118454 [Lampris incognitus]XP_056142881.1 uncharacterized protein LOC130118454 [Lampris incognitus]
MPGPAAVNAVAVAGWLLAALGPCLSLPAEDSAEPGFSLCSHCFYRQKPPQGASAGALLRPLCHSLPRGQAFATLYNPTCDTAAYSAFHLSHGWTERGGEEGEELVVIKNEADDVQVLVPALLQGVGSESRIASPTNTPPQRWDLSVAEVVRSILIPDCNSLGGDLYILTGAGGLGAAEGGDAACRAKFLWSAVCCTVSEEEGGFSIGLVREEGEGERDVSVKELEEMLGVSELFSEGCTGTHREIKAGEARLLREALSGNVEKLDPEASSQDANENVGESAEAPVAKEQVASNEAEPEEVRNADVTRETSSVTSEGTLEEQSDTTHSEAANSEFLQSSDDNEMKAAAETDTETSSTLVWIIYSTLSLLTTPLRLVVSAITQLPGQVTYILQEDLGVLSVLPGDTFSLFHLITSDLVSGLGSAVDMLLGLGETCFSCVYHCTSSMLEALLTSCQTGVTGVGVLASDTVGIFSGAVDNAWWVTSFFGGRLWEQSEGYVGTLVSEMGGQAKTVGGGLGSLAWRSGNGVGNVVGLVSGLIMGAADMVFGAVRGAFGQESE